MNRRMVYRTVGQIIELEAAMLLIPMLVALIYGEMNIVPSFLIPAVCAGVLGFIFAHTFPPRDRILYARDGFMIVALAWLVLSGIGALPFVISREIPSYIDAFFETASGFTTTGATIIRDVEALSHGTLFWRSFTHWVGGMGVIVLMMAIIPQESGTSMYIMKAEMPGPIVGKLVPRIRQTAKVLYLIYLGLTALQVFLLCAGGMPIFDSLVHTFGTAGTGGFGIKADCLASYTPYQQWITAIFMLIFGVNFNLYYLILIRRARSAFKSEELWAYIGIVLVASGIICYNIRSIYPAVSDAARQSVFQVASIITTTGYSTANFDTWPQLSRHILLILMFIGGCAGSTAGGLKVSRVVMMIKNIKINLKKLIHPRAVGTVRFEGKAVESETLQGLGVYFGLYSVLLILTLLILAFDPIAYNIETNFSAAVSCFNNVGPGLGGVGPALSYADYSPLSKLVLSFSMLLGRLEIYPLILIMFPSTWRRGQ